MTAARATPWLAIREIAEAGLPGLPGDPRRVRDLALAKGWADQRAPDGKPLARPRNARGGGLEYHISLLPAEAQTRLLPKIEAVPIAANFGAPSVADVWAWYEALPAMAKAKAEQAKAILLEIEAQVIAGAGRTAAKETAAAKHGVSPRAIDDWHAKVRAAPRSDWAPLLAPRYKTEGKKMEIDAEAWRLLRSDYLRPEKPAFAACYNRVLEEYCRPRGISLPAKATLKRRLDAEVSKRVKVARREGKEALRRTIPPQKRSVADLHAMQLVNVDGHTFDVFVEWEDGQIGRPVMVGIQDVYSRKLLAHEIGRTESSRLARRTFANLFQEWGIPGEAVLDNGRGFASKKLTGGAKTRFRFMVKELEQTGVLTALGIITHWTLPYRGSSKPIERAWKTLCEDIAKHAAMSGAYTGNKPDAKPENYRERAIPIAEFRQHVARYIAAYNARSNRQTETAQGRSFDDAFIESYAASAIGRANAVQMRIALLEAEERRCHRQHGAVTLYGNSYWSDRMSELAGEKVIVRFDPDNLHSEVHIYDLKDRYLFAVPIHEKTGFLSQEGAVRRAKAEADLRKSVKAAIEKQDLLTAAQVAELQSGHAEPTPRPQPGASRIVRSRRHGAAAPKPSQQVAPEAADPAFFDSVCAGSARLRPVE